MCLAEGYVEATTKGAQVIVNEVRFELNINVLKYDCTNIVIYITRAVLRLECSLDCISGSVGHQQNIFIFSLSALLLKLKKM